MKNLNIKLLLVFYSTISIVSAQTSVTTVTGLISGPFGIVADNSGNLYVSNYTATANSIYKIVLSPLSVTLIAGSATAGGHANNTTGTSATFSQPMGIALDGSGNLYVADDLNHQIRKIVLTAPYAVTLFAGGSTGLLPGSTNAIGHEARFKNPHGICWDGGAYLYVADYGNGSIRRITLADTTVALFASIPFGNPYGIAYDLAGNLFVSDYANEEIDKIVISPVSESTWVGAAGSGSNGCSPNATGASAWLNEPTGIAINGNGNVYVADESADVLWKIVESSTATTIFAGACSTPGNANGPPLTGAGCATFTIPVGLAIDKSGHMFITDNGNNLVREITGITLPIQLLSFDAKYMGEENMVAINWSTASEKNNNKFTIEKSADGATFVKVADVTGAGNSDVTRYYTTADNNPWQGTSYYRLKQTDFDGKYSYSNVVSVFHKDETNFDIYPNPVSESLNVLYSSEAYNSISISVTDISGRVVTSTSYTVSRGDNKLAVSMEGLSAGIYILQVVNATGRVIYKKFIKQ